MTMVPECLIEAMMARNESSRETALAEVKLLSTFQMLGVFLEWHGVHGYTKDALDIARYGFSCEQAAARKAKGEPELIYQEAKSLIPGDYDLWRLPGVEGEIVRHDRDPNKFYVLLDGNPSDPLTFDEAEALLRAGPPTKREDTIAELVPRLTEDQKKFLMSIINRLGDGQHPMADKNTLPHFTKSYVKELMEKAKTKVNTTGLAIIEQFVNII